MSRDVDVQPIRRLHIGCGRNPLSGWVNLDRFPGPGVDVAFDLEECATVSLPFESDSFSEFLGSHVIEHVKSTLPLMQELYRVARPGALAVLRTPYGSSDDAYEDPTHVRPYFLHSFGYFSQPYYWRADYGYRGDWRVEEILLTVEASRFANRSVFYVLSEVQKHRNLVLEMEARLRAVKPARAPLRELREAPPVRLVLV